MQQRTQLSSFQRPGRDKYCRNYDFVYRLPTQIFGTATPRISTSTMSVEMTMTSVRGHMMEFEFPEEFKWQRCDPSELFAAPLLHRITKVYNDC